MTKFDNYLSFLDDLDYYAVSESKSFTKFKLSMLELSIRNDKEITEIERTTLMDEITDAVKELL